MRALISIGCDDYDLFPKLSGAEKDAENIYRTLLNPAIGDYSTASSAILLSPTSEEVRETLRRLLFSGNPIDTLTIFFAGHGGAHAGSYYLHTKDTNPKAISATSISLSDILRQIAESSPSQSNIIIDACQSGGLVSDLPTILKSNLIGNAGSPGVTLVATSAQNQLSGETEEGGFGTMAILDCIRGNTPIQESSEALDLIEIGRHLSQNFRENSQTPVVWGLNLYGPRRFCRNPCFQAPLQRPLSAVVRAWPTSSESSLRKHFEILWDAYRSTSEQWNARTFSDSLSCAFSSLHETPEVLASVAERFAAAAIERARDANDPFRPSQVAAAIAVCLAPYTKNRDVYEVCERIISIAANDIESTAAQLMSELERTPYALLSAQSGLANLYYLPLRIPKILAWLSFAHHYILTNYKHRLVKYDLGHLIKVILEHYQGSLVALNNCQSSYWAVCLPYINRIGLTAEAETIAGLIFHSYITNKAQIAASDLPPDRACEFLLRRHRGNFDNAIDLLERPDQLLTVLLQVSFILNLESEFDIGLWKIDGTSFSAYINTDLSCIGAETMIGGHNHIWKIGQDVFRVADFRSSWPKLSPPGNRLEADLETLASFLFPDRVAWFYINEKDFAFGGMA